MSEPQKKGTPILMKFFADAFAAHLGMVKVNLSIHQYRDALAPSGESDNELLQASINAIGNAKPVVQNSLMSSKRIMELPDLPRQLVDDIDLHSKWCEISLQDLDLCDSTIRNLIMSKSDYLSILKEALDPYREQLGIDEEYEYPGDYGAPEEEPLDDSADTPVEEAYDNATVEDPYAADAEDIVESEPVDEAPAEPVIDESAVEELEARHRAEIAQMKAEMDRLQRSIYEMSEEMKYRAYNGSEPVQIPVRMASSPSPYPEDLIPEDAPLEFPLDEQDDVPVDEPIPEGEIVDDFIPEEQPVIIEQPKRPTLMRISPVGPAASPVKVSRGAHVAPHIVEEPAPAPARAPVVEDAAVPVEEAVHVAVPGEVTVEPSDNGYEGLFGYDQYDMPEDEVKPLSEDPARFEEIAQKASEVIAAAKKKVGRTATKSSASRSAKSKSGAARKPSKPAAKRTVKKKAAPKADTETDSETSSPVAKEDE